MSLVRGWRGILLGVIVGVGLLTIPAAAACELAAVTGCDPTEPTPSPPAPAPAPTPPTPAPAPELPTEPPVVVLGPDTEAAEARLLVLVNDDRKAHGLAPLNARADVKEIAEGHSAAMAKGHDIWHNDAYFSAATKRRLGAARVGENVALNRSADDAHRKLMASPRHRANILDPGYSVVGIAAAADEEGRLYITEDFLEPAAPPGPPAVPAAPRPPVVAAGPPAAAAVSVAAPPPTVEPVPEAVEVTDGPFELASGPQTSLPEPVRRGKPWAAYFLAVTLLAAVAVGFRKVAC